MALLLHLRKNLINSLNIKKKSIQQRTISTSPLLWFNRHLFRSVPSKEREKRYKEKDKVPENYRLIYKAPMESYVAWATHVSTLTATIIGAAAVFQYASNQPILEPVGTTLVMHSEDLYYFAAGFLAINGILRLVVSMFPLRIYKNQGKYLAVYHSQLPGGLSHHNFEQGKVKEVFYTFSPWNNATYKLGSKSSLLLENYFKTPSEFHKMFEDPNEKKL